MRQIVAVIHEDFEDLELWYPVIRLREEGFKVVLAGEEKGRTYHGKYGVPATADIAYDEIKSGDYDGMVIPGGWAPDKIRRFSPVLDAVRTMYKEAKPIAQICHAGWVTISAGILKGVHVTSTPAIKDDMENAGAVWEDKEVVVDNHIVSSRRPQDLPAYVKTFIEVLDSGENS
ncbi:MAG: type 1 glutamine amidotransferase domain-containing protein [Spirochaetaceae bacterium]